MATFKAQVTSPVVEFTMCLLHSVTNAHILHLQSRSYSQHQALGTFYTEIGELVDSFVESYQGKYGLLTNYPSDFMVPEAPISYIEYLMNEVETYRNKPGFPQDSELQNEIDNIANLLNSTLYKLRFLA
jgi:hypothetical protein